MTKIDENWFYSSTNILLKFLTVFIKGDSLIILPFFVFILILSLFNSNLAIITGLVFLSLRFLGEMIYWFLQQFSDKKYRPDDYGFKKLSNNSIYIIYQLFSLVMATFFISILIYFIFF